MLQLNQLPKVIDLCLCVLHFFSIGFFFFCTTKGPDKCCIDMDHGGLFMFIFDFRFDLCVQEIKKILLQSQVFDLNGD